MMGAGGCDEEAIPGEAVEAERQRSDWFCEENRKLRAELAANAATIAAQAAEIERLKAEATWVRRKLKLPEDATSSKLYGEMHVFEAHAHGYTAYIASYKCDDKQGEIGRLSHEVFTKDAELAALRSQLDEQRKRLDGADELLSYPIHRGLFWLKRGDEWINAPRIEQIPGRGFSVWRFKGIEPEYLRRSSSEDDSGEGKDWLWGSAIDAYQAAVAANWLTPHAEKGEE